MEEYLDLVRCEMCGNDCFEELTMNSDDMIICHHCQLELDCEDIMNEGYLDDC